MPKHKKVIAIQVSVRDREDKELCQRAATLNRYRSISEWIRAIITGHLNMMGMKPLKRVTRQKTHCVNGHKFTPETTRLLMQPSGYKSKLCRICARNSTRKYYDRVRRKKPIREV